MPAPKTPPPLDLRPADTSAEAYRLQAEIYGRMTGAQRLSIAFALTETVRALALAGIRRRHPDYTDDQVWSAWARLRLGDDLFREAWPGRPLLAP